LRAIWAWTKVGLGKRNWKKTLSLRKFKEKSAFTIAHGYPFSLFHALLFLPSFKEVPREI
jgi:hypothetical protein